MLMEAISLSARLAFDGGVPVPEIVSGHIGNFVMEGWP
jgi:hypothetical protein